MNHAGACGSNSGCLIQRRRLVWLTQIIQILPIKGAERGFDRGAEAGYALPNTFAEKRRPNSGLHENSWRANRGRAAGMKFAIQFRALAGGDVIEKFRAHLSVTTLHTNEPDLATHA